MEPRNTAEAVCEWGLDYVVLTSVDRDGKWLLDVRLQVEYCCGNGINHEKRGKISPSSPTVQIVHVWTSVFEIFLLPSLLSSHRFILYLGGDTDDAVFRKVTW
jgi:hypothetical protein